MGQIISFNKKEKIKWIDNLEDFIEHDKNKQLSRVEIEALFYEYICENKTDIIVYIITKYRKFVKKLLNYNKFIDMNVFLNSNIETIELLFYAGYEFCNNDYFYEIFKMRDLYFILSFIDVLKIKNKFSINYLCKLEFLIGALQNDDFNVGIWFLTLNFGYKIIQVLEQLFTRNKVNILTNQVYYKKTLITIKPEIIFICLKIPNIETSNSLNTMFKKMEQNSIKN